MLTVAWPAGPAAAASDPKGDALDGQPDHDLTEVTVSETGDDLRFTVRVAGRIRAPMADAEEVRVEFKVTPAELYTPGMAPQPGGIRHAVVLSTEHTTYGAFRFGAFGYILPTQPSSGSSSATFVVPKAYLDATLARRPLAGDWVSDIVVRTHAFQDMDTASHPDVRLTQDSDPGTKLWLRAAGMGGERGLKTQTPPEGSRVATAALWHDTTLEAWWRSDVLTSPLKLRDLSVALWLTTTTSSPVVSNENLHVELHAEDAAGRRTLVAARAESLSGTPGVNTNLFLTPGVPQRMPFQLERVDGVERVHAGDRVALRVAVSGFMADESGPIMVYYNNPDFDSFLLAGKSPLPRPDRSSCPDDDGVGTGRVENLPKPRCDD